MHFALPPRKTTRPPVYAARNNKSPYLSRARLRTFAWVAGAALFLILLLSQLRKGSSSERIPPGTAPVVIITIFDNVSSSRYEQMIRNNRHIYASRHGYATFFPNTTNYKLDNTPSPPSPPSWAKIPATRHALTLYPHSAYFWFLSQHALIMNPSLSLHAHILSPPRLESLIIPNQPVVPPDSVIKTLSTPHASRIDLILTQPHRGLCHENFILRRGEWAKFFLDAWFDPLYRSYNFERAEGHALEHLIQWHATVLGRLALVPQRIMNSYTRTERAEERYGEGDLVAHFHGCDDKSAGRSCEEEVTPMYEHFVSAAQKDTG